MLALSSREDPSSSPRYHSVPLLNHRDPLLALTITFLAISWIASLLRFYVRFVVQRTPGWDDFFIVLTMLSTTIASVVLCIMTNIGLGQPVHTLSLAERQNILKTIYIVTATYPLSGAFVKSALLLQYMQYFSGKRLGVLCKSVLVLTVVSGLAFGACSWVSCWPVKSFWDFSVEGVCWGFASRQQLDFMRISVVQVVISAALSLIVFLIPLWLSFRLETTTSTQLSMVGLFLLGLCAIICSLWRAGFIIELALIDGEFFDPVWDNPTVMGLASYEANLAAVCSALPVLWPVIKEKWNRIFVTYEVRVTEEYEPFPGSRGGGATDLELQSTSSDRGAVMESNDSGWEPFVGDETTGLGKNTTVVQAPTSVKWPTKVKGVLLKT